MLGLPWKQAELQHKLREARAHCHTHARPPTNTNLQCQCQHHCPLAALPGTQLYCRSGDHLKNQPISQQKGLVI